MGKGRLAKQYIEDAELGIQIDEMVDADADLAILLASNNTDEVIIALEPEEYGKVTKHISACHLFIAWCY